MEGDVQLDDVHRVASSEDVTSSTSALPPISTLPKDGSATATPVNSIGPQQNVTFPSYPGHSDTGISGSRGSAFIQPFSSEHYGRYQTEDDDRHMSTRRRPQLTFKGREYQVDLLRKRNTILARRIKQQVTILDGLQMGIDRDTIKAEVARLDQALQELDGVNSRILDMLGDTNEGNLLRQTMEEFETLAVRSKQGAYALISRSSSGGSCSSSSSKKDVRHWITQSQTSDNHVAMELPQEWQNDETSNYSEMLHVTDELRCKLTQQLGAIEDLLSQGNVRVLTEELETLELLHQQLVYTTNNVLALLPDEHMKRVEMAKLDAIESNVCEVKEGVYSYLAQRNNRERGRTSTPQVSTVKMVSREASRSRQVKFHGSDGTPAVEATRKVHNATYPMAGDQHLLYSSLSCPGTIMAEKVTHANQDLSCPTSTLPRISYDSHSHAHPTRSDNDSIPAVASSTKYIHPTRSAMDSPLASNIMKPRTNSILSVKSADCYVPIHQQANTDSHAHTHHPIRPDNDNIFAVASSTNCIHPTRSATDGIFPLAPTITKPRTNSILSVKSADGYVPLHQRANTDSSFPVSLTDEHILQAASSDSPSHMHHSSKPTAETAGLTQVMLDFAKLQAAPKPTLDIFAGDPLHYSYFRMAFRDVIESCVPDERGRLNRLLTYTSGPAKELVRTCIYCSDEDCFTNAMKLLHDEYGNKLKIARAYIKQLKDQPNVKGSDPEAWKKLYRFLLQCHTFKATGHLKELDRPDIISSIITKLEPNFQDRWTALAEKVERTEEREVSFEDLLEFIKVQSARASHPTYSRQALKNFKSLATRAKLPCHICQTSSNHPVQDCPAFKELSIDDRFKKVFQERLCFDCLKPISDAHTAKNCTNKLTCDICWSDHPTVLHKDAPNPEVLATEKICSATNGEGQVSMCVILVRIQHKDNPEKERLVYALLDQDCTSCFALPSLLLELAPNKLIDAKIGVDTMNGSTGKTTKSVTGLIVRCSQEHASKYESPAVELSRTYGADELPFSKEDMPSPDALKEWGYLQEVVKSLPTYDENIPFGLIIGAPCVKALEPHECILSRDNGPFAYRTVLGWCIVGPSASPNVSAQKCCFTRVRVNVQDVVTGKPMSHYFRPENRFSDTTISSVLQAMYDTEFSEKFRENKALSAEDRKFLDIMKEGVKKVGGKYEAPIPLRDPNIELPPNKEGVTRRLLAHRGRMRRDLKYKYEYTNNMNKLITERAESFRSASSQVAHWFIPHHGVQGKGKPMRVVFDCSAKYGGRSLNDELLQGPDLVNLLVGVLIRFRKEVVAYSADLEACFHQIQIPPEQRHFFSFLWWLNGDTSRAIQEYQMCVHLFGAVSSPSIANYIVKRMGVDSEEVYGKDVRRLLEREFYVDNLLTSSPTEAEAVSLLSRTIAACGDGGFNLRKVASNSRAVNESVADEKRASSLGTYDIGKMLAIEKALGVIWYIELDQLGFRITIHDHPLSRRNILATISSIYDPLGLIAPFLLRGRKILQAIAADGHSWDDELLEQYRQEWRAWRLELEHLKNLTIQRCYKPNDFGEIVDSSLHHFCDANSYGYGVASYLRQVNNKGEIIVSLIFGKSRVSPLKAISVPRLELIACTLSAEVGHMIMNELDIDQLTQFFWTDSNICLGYIYNDVKRFRVFVANRQEKILYYTDKQQWRKVDSSQNPADHASRGISIIRDKHQTYQWFGGPGFLSLPMGQWELDTDQLYSIPADDPEIKKTVVVNVVKVTDDDRFYLLSYVEHRFSKWNVIVRIVGWMHVFSRALRQSQHVVQTGTQFMEEARRLQLPLPDIKIAEITLLRLIQAKSFAQELLFYGETRSTVPKALRKGKGHIWRLDPFVDTDGLLRVGGRIRRSLYSDTDKHPVILPKGSILVRRILEFYHMQVQHGGRPATVNSVRSHGFWAVSLNAQIKSLIHNCVPCRRYRGRCGEQKMADLPEERVTPEAPFTNSGADACGPFKVKDGRKTNLRFVLLFTCFSSRAIHLESITNLSTDCFILALRRFLARRGPMASLKSDNGTNFVGAANEFRKQYNEMDHTRIAKFLSDQRCEWIRWERNVPDASHAGGVWERQIRSVRNTLTSLLHEHSSLLTDEVFRTLLAEAELIVNSRPITADPDNPEAVALSPIQLLTLKSKVVLPPPGEFQKEDIYCRKRWRHVQHLANVFWSRYRKEYLQSLQARNKWQRVQRDFQVGDIVLLKDGDGLVKVPRQQWPMGKITQVFPSEDGLVRSVELKVPTATSLLKRPIQKLVLLVEAQQS